MTTMVDVLIIGAGPCGLFQVFELGLLGIRAHMVDALPRIGGQCTYLYPEKPIYDIPALPVVGAQELIDRLAEQIRPFGPVLHLNEQVRTLGRNKDGSLRLTTSKGNRFDARAVVIAAGVGGFPSASSSPPASAEARGQEPQLRGRGPGALPPQTGGHPRWRRLGAGLGAGALPDREQRDPHPPARAVSCPAGVGGTYEEAL